jgi:hypothetical protein
MAAPKRLVLFVEGEGDRDAVPILVKKLLTDMNGWPHLFLDPDPFVVGNAADVTKDDGKEWLRVLNIARRRPNLGAILLLQDGDLARIRGESFCAARFGARLALWARAMGAGERFSLATVFVCQEYESWLLACLGRLAGLSLPDGRPGIPEGAVAPADNPEDSPRDAKGWLDDLIESGYKPTRDQALFTSLMVDHLDTVRQRGLRSFRRLENALAQLVNGVGSGNHVATPHSSGG